MLTSRPWRQTRNVRAAGGVRMMTDNSRYAMAPVHAGQQITAAGEGAVRPLGTVNGLLVSGEGAVEMPGPGQSSGVALDAPDPFTRLAPVMVSLR